MSGDDLRDLARAARAEMASGEPAPAGGLEAHGEQPGDVIGSYELVRPIGEGGMGTVWEVRQRGGLERRAALKLVKSGMDTGRVVARFEAERQALARMEHPHIASVFDGGATEAGRPYFVMELVEGLTITRFAAEKGLDLDARVELLVQVCAALEHAHQKGVIHRDVKPSNVLVTTVDGRPHVKVIDFGIARVTEEEGDLKTRLTTDAEIVGTLEFMAPEQARGADVDTRADVYATGALLYELLTGAGPFDFSGEQRPGLEEALRMVREVDPVRPSIALGRSAMGGPAGLDLRRDQPRLASELDWIVLRALEKERERRYPTVASLGADLGRFRAGDPVEARPPSRSYLLSKFVRRNRGLVASLAAIFVLLTGGIAGTLYGLAEALDANESLEAAIGEKETQRKLAVEEGERADREAKSATRSLALMREANGFLSRILTGAIPRHARGKDKELMVAVLEDATKRLGSGEITDPVVEAGVTVDVAEAWVGLGRLKAALGHFEDARERYLTELDERSIEVLGVDRRRADILRLLERSRESIDLYRNTVVALNLTVGAHASETLAAERGLASALHRAGQIPEAKERLERAVATERDVLSDEQRSESSAMAELATLEFFAFRNGDRAKELLTEALALVREHQGVDHPYALRYLETLSQIEATLGNLDEAIAMSAELSEQFARIYGPEHQQTLAFEGNRAFTLLFAGRLEESETLFRKVLEAQRRTLGDDAPDTLWTRQQVALADVRGGRIDEAIEELVEVVDVVTGRGLPAFEELSSLAEALVAAGRVEDARATLEDAIKRVESQMGEGHPIVRQLQGQLEMLPSDG